MKTFIKKSLVVVTLFGTMVGYGMDITSKVVKEGTIIKVSFSNLKKGEKIVIKTDLGKTLYSEVVRKSGLLIKKFDFASLKDGNYTLEINKDFEIEVSPFLVKGGKVQFLEKVQKLFKPVVRTKNNKVFVSQLNFGISPLEVEIYFEGERIYSDTLVGESVLERVYSLNEEIKGNYTVFTKVNNRTYENSFSL